MAVTLWHLAIFEQVAFHGSVTKAGEGLLISQSWVSMALAELERMSAGELFARSGRRLYLNERGRQLLPEVQEILQRVTHLEQALQESADDPAGILLMGASITIGNYLLPALFGRFARRYRRARWCCR
jgi:DNA-binding transcriptional LysR family regulator